MGSFNGFAVWCALAELHSSLSVLLDKCEFGPEPLQVQRPDIGALQYIYIYVYIQIYTYT